MIKRQLYRVEHRDQDDEEASDSSSSDDASEPANEPSTADEEGGEETPAAAESPESGYQSENSSDSDEDFHNAEAWPHQLTSDDDGCPERHGDGLKQNRNSELGSGVNETLKLSQSKLSNQWAEAVDDTERDRTLDELDDCVIKYKSVFKCRLCPRIVCLSEQTMRVHLDSKRHARSQKLYAEGRLKLMLNSDGEVEEEMETHAERHARIMASVQQVNKSRKRNKGRQRQKQRAKKKKSSVMANMKTKGKQSSEVCEKKKNARRDMHHKDT